MDSPLKTVLGTVLGALSMVAASYSANWLANHTYRAKPRPPMLAEVPRQVPVPAHYFNTPRTIQQKPLRVPELRHRKRDQR